MSSFLFQKEQVDCACFQSNSNSIRKIFRSDPHQPPVTSTKDIKDFSFTNQGQKIKNKKKSLKKEKPSSLPGSDKDEKCQDEACQDLNMPQVNVKSQMNATNKLQANYFHHVETGRYQALISQRNRPIYSMRPSQQAVATFSQNFIPLNKNLTEQIPRSEHRIKLDQKEQYDQLVQQEFKKDFYQFKLNMEIKENEEKLKTERQRQATERQLKQKQEKQKLYKQRASIEQLQKRVQQELQNQRKQQIQYQNKQKTNKEKYLKEKQLREREAKVKQLRQKDLFTNKKERAQKRKESFSANKIHLEKMQSLPAIPHMKLIQKPFLDDHRENPLKSLRNSAISHRERETLTKRTKGMCPKQIESEKDGSSESDSDRMSEVVGRGWDGLTQQKIQMEQLDQMVKDEQNKSETLVTRESHIKNSQIKTFTDYTSSFISPKSQQANPTAFGGGQKYGLAGMSYQLIDDLGKGKAKSNSKIFF